MKVTQLLTLTGAIGLLSAPLANAGLVDIVSGPIGGADGGGTFKIIIEDSTGLEKVIGGKPPGFSLSDNEFLTFCLEKNEYFTPGLGDPRYNTVVSTAAVAGGVGGGSPDPISKATAWLFSQFAAGTLDDQTFTGGTFSYIGNDGANDLQRAIWYLEGEISTLSTANGMYLVNKAVTESASATSLYGVRVLNLTDSKTGAKAQDMLVVVPEPSTYIAGGLLGLPVLLGALRRRAAKVA